jgi:IS5 family transposase
MWTPPADQVVTDTGWRPPADAVDTGAPQGQSFKQALSGAVQQAIQTPANIAQNLTPEKMTPYLPVAGAIAGTALGGPIGGAIGAGGGQILKRMAGMAYGTEPLSTAQTPTWSDPSTYLNKESIAPMAQAAGQAIFDAKPIPQIASAIGGAVGRGAARLGEAVSGVPAQDIRGLFSKPGTLWSLGSKAKAGEAIGDAKAATPGFSQGVTNDASTFTAENVQKALNVKSNGEQALTDIAKAGNGTAEQLGDALKYVSDEIKGKLAKGQDASELINMQTHLNGMLDKVAPDIQAARQAYAPLAQRDKFLNLVPHNKNNTISKANLFYLTSILGTGGGLLGGKEGAGKAVGAGMIARAPIMTGVTTSGLGAAYGALTNPMLRSALLSAYIDRLWGSKPSDQSQGQ